MQKTSKLVLCIAGTAVLLVLGSSALAYQNPIASAGPDVYVTTGTYSSNPSAVLQGEGSDPNGGTVSFYWSCTGGSVSNNSVPRPLFSAPSNVWWNETYTCALTVTNSYGISSSDSTTVYANYDLQNPGNRLLTVQTDNASDNFNAQATLNGTVSGTSGTVYTWFEWGTTTSYGRESNHMPILSQGHFDQHIAELLPNTVYHFRAVAQKAGGNIVYGQDMTFTSANYGNLGFGQYTPGQVAGASTIATGLTNNLLVDSFLIPLLIIIAGLWLYFSGKADMLARKVRALITG